MKRFFFTLFLIAGMTLAYANTSNTGLRYDGQWLSTYDSIVINEDSLQFVTITMDDENKRNSFDHWSISGDLKLNPDYTPNSYSIQISSYGAGKGRLTYSYNQEGCGGKSVSINIYKRFDPNLQPYNIVISGPDCILEGDTVVYSIEPILTKNLTQGIGVDEYFWDFSSGLVQEHIYKAGDNSSVTFVAGEVNDNSSLSVQVGIANASLPVSKTLGKTAPKPTIISHCITHGEQEVLFIVSDPQSGVKYNWNCSDDSWIIDVDSLHTDSAYISPANDASATITVIAYYEGDEQCSASYTTVKVGRQWSSNAQISCPSNLPYIMNREYEFTLEGAAGGGLNWTPPTGWLLITNQYSEATGYTAKLKPTNENLLCLVDTLIVTSKITCSSEPQRAKIPVYIKPAKVLTMDNTTCIPPNSNNTFSIKSWETGPHAVTYEWKFYKEKTLIKDTITTSGTELTVRVTPDMTKLVIIPIGEENGSTIYYGDSTEFTLTFGPESPQTIIPSKNCIAYNMPDEIILTLEEITENSTQIYDWDIPLVLEPQYQNSRHTSVKITTDGQPNNYDIYAWGLGSGLCGYSDTIQTTINIVEDSVIIQYFDYMLPAPMNFHVKGYGINNYGTRTILTYDWYFFDNGSIVDGLDSNTGSLVNFKGSYSNIQDIKNSLQYGLVCIVTFTNQCKVLVTYGVVPDLSQISLVHAPIASTMQKKNTLENNTQIQLYPNPTNDNIVIDISPSKKEVADIYIVDVLGNIVSSRKAFRLGNRYNLAPLPSGQYIMCIKIGDEQFTQLFIKQ